jgi:hypothetical protein
MPSLLDVFRYATGIATLQQRLELTNAVAQLVRDTGSVRKTARMLEIPLTSFNRGLNTNFETTTPAVIERLINAVKDKGVAFKTEQRFTTRYDFVQYNPGSISRLGLQTLPNGQQATAFRVVFQTDEYTQSGRFGSTPMVAIDGVNIDDWIEGSGLPPEAVQSVVFM